MIGLDLVEINRFQDLKREDALIKKVFTKREIDYCYAYKDPATHLAGTFAAKEATIKALGNNNLPVYDIEVRRRKDGKPQVWKKKQRLFDVFISITHTETTAGAIAFVLIL